MGQLQHPVLGTLEVPDRLLQPENREELEGHLLQMAADTLPDDEAWYETFTKQFGRTASETARGAGELIGVEPEGDDYTIEFVRRARGIQNPKSAFAGQVAGALGDVPSALFGGWARKGAGLIEDLVTRGFTVGGVSGALAPVYDMFGDSRVDNATIGAALGGALGGSAGLVLRKLGYRTEEELVDTLRNASDSERKQIEADIDLAMRDATPAPVKYDEPPTSVATPKDIAEAEANAVKKAEADAKRVDEEAVAAEETTRIRAEFDQNLANERAETLNFEMRKAQDEINELQRAEFDRQIQDITTQEVQTRQLELDNVMKSKIVPAAMNKPIQDVVVDLKKQVKVSKNKLTYIQKQIDKIDAGDARVGAKGRGINALRAERDRLTRDLMTDEGFLKQAQDVQAARKESIQLKREGTSPVVQQRVAQKTEQITPPVVQQPVQVQPRQAIQTEAPTPQQPVRTLQQESQPLPEPTQVASVPTAMDTPTTGFLPMQRWNTPEAPVSPSQPRSLVSSATPQGKVSTAPAPTTEAPSFKPAGAVERAVGAISTRMRERFPAVFNRLRQLEANTQEFSNVPVNESKPFFDSMKRLSPEAQTIMKGHLYNGRFDEAKELMSPEMRKAFSTIRKNLAMVKTRAKEAGIDLGDVDNYFPRSVRDIDGLRNAIGRKHKTEMDRVIEEYRTKNNVPITPEIEAQLLNKVVRNIERKKQVRLAGKGKRTVQQVSDELLQFYDEPQEALTHYFQKMGRDIEVNKFMGRSAVRDTEGNIIPDDSIGNVIKDMRLQYNMQAEEERELLNMLQARFIEGEKAMNKLFATGRDLGYIGTIANVVSAITNLGDLGTSAALHGVRNTVKSMLGRSGSNKYDVIDMGIDHTIAHELRGNKSTASLLNKMFKGSGFAAIDRLGKNTVMNAAMRKNESMVKTPAGEAKFRAKWGKIFGDETDVLIRDLKQGQVTSNTKLLAFNELADVQPIALSEMPEAYLKNPDMRILYMLKSFTLKQYDIVRREIVREFKKGNQDDAIAKATALVGYVTAANVGTQLIKDFVQGREIRPEDLPEKAVWTLLGVYGLNNYVAERYLSQGDISGAVKATLFPPMPMFDSAGKLLKEGSKALEDEEYNLAKATRALPIIGPLVYAHFGGGKENYNERLD